MISLKSLVVISAVFILGTVCLTAGQDCPYPSEDITYLVDYNNCSMYYQCYEGIKTHLECPPGFMWNDVDDTCDFPDEVDCTRSHSTTPTPKPTGTTPPTRSTTPNDNICAGQATGTMLPDPDDCHKFIECVFEKEQEFTCPAGTSWNEAILACDTSNPDCAPPVCSPTQYTPVFYPVPGDCKRYFECFMGVITEWECPFDWYWNIDINMCGTECKNETETTTTSPTTTPTTTTPTTTTTRTTTTLLPSTTDFPNPCPYPSDQMTFFPNPFDCTKYVECYEGVRYDMSCPPGLFWNQYAKTCDHVCNGTTSTPPDDITTAAAATTTPIVTPTPTTKPTTVQPSTYTTPGGRDPDCPATGVSYLPNYADCHSFFVCVNGEKSGRHCEPGYAWSIILNACDREALVDCSYTTLFPPTTTRPTTTSLQTTTRRNDCPASGISYLPHYSDCTKYFQCKDGTETMLSCPDGYAWSIVIDACDRDFLVDCSYTTLAPPTTTPPNNDECPATGIGFLPDYADCTKFYQCIEGEKTLMPCPEGYAWDININKCELASTVDCSYTTTGPYTSTPGFTPDPLCPYPSNIVTYWPHPYNCTYFYECLNGLKYIMECPSGFAWSVVTVKCQEKNNVDCSYTSKSPNVTTATPITSTAAPQTTTPIDNCAGRADGTLLPYVPDCRKFIECDGGKSNIYPCGDGTSWNKEKQTCDTNNTENCKTD